MWVCDSAGRAQPPSDLRGPASWAVGMALPRVAPCPPTLTLLVFQHPLLSPPDPTDLRLLFSGVGTGSPQSLCGHEGLMCTCMHTHSCTHTDVHQIRTCTHVQHTCTHAHTTCSYILCICVHMHTMHTPNTLAPTGVHSVHTRTHTALSLPTHSQRGALEEEGAGCAQSVNRGDRAMAPGSPASPVPLL